MDIILNSASMIPIYEQLIRQIKAKIADGDLAPGTALPSVRVLAAELQISALTVKKAYDRLEAEHVIVTVHGKGSYVADTTPGLMTEARQREVESTLSDALARARASGMSTEEIRELIDILLEE